MKEEGDLRYTIDTDTLGDEVLGKSTGETNNGTFGCGIIDHGPCTAESHDGSGVDDSVRRDKLWSERYSLCDLTRHPSSCGAAHIW